jgi:hypothetical protein
MFTGVDAKSFLPKPSGFQTRPIQPIVNLDRQSLMKEIFKRTSCAMQ